MSHCGDLGVTSLLLLPLHVKTWRTNEGILRGTPGGAELSGTVSVAHLV